MIKYCLQYTFGNDLANLVLAHYNRSVWHTCKIYEFDDKLGGLLEIFNIPGPNSRVMVTPVDTNSIAIVDGSRLSHKIMEIPRSHCLGASADGKSAISALFTYREDTLGLVFHNIQENIRSKCESRLMRTQYQFLTLVNNRYAIGHDLMDDRPLLVFDVLHGKEVQYITYPTIYEHERSISVDVHDTSPTTFHAVFITQRDFIGHTYCYRFNASVGQYEKELQCRCFKLDQFNTISLPTKYHNFQEKAFGNTRAQIILCTKTLKTSIIAGIDTSGRVSYMIAPVHGRIHSSVECDNGVVTTVTRAIKRKILRVRFYPPPGSL